MKVIVTFFLLTLAIAEIDLKQQVGISCERSPKFTVTSFDITPWPITVYSPYTITMKGEFVQKEYAYSIQVATRYAVTSWHYITQYVDQYYEKGSQANFTVVMQTLSTRGPYTDKVTLHTGDNSILSCWQFDYTI